MSCMAIRSVHLIGGGYKTMRRNVVERKRKMRSGGGEEGAGVGGFGQ